MINPVLRREIKTNMRSWKTYFIITLYLALLFSIIIFFTSVANINQNGMGFVLKYSINLYIIITVVQLILIMITAPALTAGAINGERERQTLDILILTKMTPLSIVIGKLLSSIGVILIMIIASIPLFAMVLNYCGMSFFNILTIFIFFITISCALGSAGIFFSTILKNVSASTVVSYIFIFLICAVNFILYMIYLSLSKNTSKVIEAFAFIMGIGINPVMGFVSILEHQLGGSFIYNLFYRGNTIIISNDIINNICFINIAFNIVFTILFLLLSARNVKSLIKV